MIEKIGEALYETQDSKEYGEYGWDGWLGAYFCNSPKDRLTMLLTMQLKDAGTTSLTRRLKNVIWSELCGGRRE